MKNSQCLLCKRVLPISEFGENKRLPRGIHYYCRRCVNDINRERLTLDFERKVRVLYNGRCVICDGIENLEIVSMVEKKRRNPRGYVLICAHCKAKGTPETGPHIRDCLKCGYRWIARVKDTITCPSCGSAYWNRPRVKL